MPPKRKRNDESAADVAASSTRATRSSARTSNSGAASSNKATAKKSKKKDGDELDSEATPPAKKTKTTKTSTKTTTSTSKTPKAAAAKKAVTSSSKAAEARSHQKSGAEKQTKSDDDVIVQKNVVPGTKASTTSNGSPPLSTKVQSSPPRPTPNEPYSAERAQALFKKYEDSDEFNTIGADGFARLCNDAQITMEGALPLILAWQFGTKEMMKITEEEWRKGTGSLKISNLPTLSMAVRDLEDLLILDKPMPQKKSKKDVYDKAAYWKYSQDRKASFNQLYMFCFTLVKPAQSKNIDMETATALWSVLLVPKYPLMGEVVAFIGDHPTTYRAANKDLWSMMLEFCDTVNPNLSDYESDEAWPTLLDNFVAWKKGQSANNESS
ncbi:DCN1-like protein 5 [Termitomyces sp. T112]|nr:DCN1-like protein 5 [Termitomyces sp. T112]